MYTFKHPYTEQQAEHLARLMRRPLPEKLAEIWLCRVLGHGFRLNDRWKCGPDEDVRPLIKKQLDIWVNNRDGEYIYWDPKALAICKELIAD